MSVETYNHHAIEVPATTENYKEANELFNEAVQVGWNLEMDWLWLATIVNLDSQKKYCYEQALYINPNSEAAKKALKSFKK